MMNVIYRTDVVHQLTTKQLMEEQLDSLDPADTTTNQLMDLRSKFIFGMDSTRNCSAVLLSGDTSLNKADPNSTGEVFPLYDFWIKLSC